MVETVLPRLLDMAVSVDLFFCHGATLAIGEVVLALSRVGGDKAGAGGAAEVLTKYGLLQKVQELVDRFIAGMPTVQFISVRLFFCY